MHIDSFAESVSNIGEAFDSFNERMEDFEKISIHRFIGWGYYNLGMLLWM